MAKNALTRARMALLLKSTVLLRQQRDPAHTTDGEAVTSTSGSGTARRLAAAPPRLLRRICAITSCLPFRATTALMELERTPSIIKHAAAGKRADLKVLHVM